MRRPFAAAMALALAAALLALPAPSEIPLGADPAEAQSAAAPLVSNIDQHTASNWDVATHDVAAAFTTGADPSGYVVSDVEIRFGAADPQGVSVKLAAGLPARTIEVAALTSEATVSPNAVNTFTAPANTALAPSTTYYIVVEGTAGSPRGTTSDAEDSGGASGWTVGDDAYYRSAGSVAGWTADRSALSIRVNGTPAGAVSRRDGLTGSSEGAIAQQSNEPEVPAGCGAVTSPTEWFSSVSAAGATGISVTLVNPLPATGQVSIELCAPLSDDGTMYGRRSGIRVLSHSPSGGDAFTVTTDTYNGSVIIVPDTDYWIRASDMYTSAKNSDWHYVRTAPARSSADSHALLNAIRAAVPIDTQFLSTDIQAYPFTTGPVVGGYTVTEATVQFAASDAGASTSVKIFNDDDSAPGSTVVATFTGSYSTAAGDYTFSAPAGTKLAASTKYWLVVNDGVSGTRAKPSLHGNIIAATILPGWKIFDREFVHRAPGATTWTSNVNRSLIFRLDGFVGDAPAPPQSLVSNIGQVGLTTSNLGTHDVATEFTTGSHRTGYTLHDVDIPFGAGDPSGVSVKLATGLPGATTEVATFTNPATLTADAVNKFTAPPSTVLQPSTTYWIVVEGTSGQPLRSSSGAEDSGGAAGWSIADTALSRTASSTGSWFSNTFGMSIRVNGYNNPVTAPGKPAAPTVTATWPVSVQVSWAAPSDPGPSGTVSDYDVRWFQGNADPADEADWTEEGDTGGPPDPGTGTSVEITGLTPNTAYRVQVRAHDGSESPWSDSVSVSTPFAVLNPEVLVSNIGQPDHATDRADLSTHNITQGFNVASVGTTFLLSTVEVEFADVPSDVRVTFGGSGGSDPITLANPATLVAGVNAFTAPVGVQLGLVRAWEIRVEAESGSIVRKSSQLEDADGKAGWTVFAESHARTPAGVISSHPPIGIRVNGRLAPQALGSNIGQPTNSLLHLASFDQAVAFTTGSHLTGYTPSDVEVSFIDFGDPPTGVSVKLATGLPSATTEVATFANPATLTTGTNKFAAPDDVVLLPDTTYYVVLEAAAGAVSTTGSDSEDSGVTEFTIGDDTFWRVMSSNGAWTADQVQVPRMRLNGWINPLTKPSRPAAPTVTATSPVSLAVSWNAPRHLGPDDAISDYDLRWFQGDADPADEADWTEEGDTGGPPDPGTATSAEIAGLRPNTAYQVQVRAHGGEESDWSPSGSATTQMEVAGARVLATNIDATDSTTVTANLDDHDFAQDFWTPGYAGGYVLKDIEVRFHTAPSDPNSIQVLLRARGDGGLGPVVAELKNPASIVVDASRLGGNTFTAPAGTVLDPNTRYLVIVRGKGSGAKLKVKAAPGGACGPAQAWCVGGTRFHFANGRTDADLIPMLLQPHGPLGIRVSGTEHDQALVSNLGQTTSGSSVFLVSVDGAMGFRTGPNAGGYALSDIEVQFGSDTPSAVSVKLATGLPASTIEVATLTNPATVTANAVNTFTAPSGTVLLPNTSYFVVVAGNLGRLSTANTDGEDGGTASGWALDDVLFHRASAAHLWVPSSGNDEMKVRVNGHAVAGVTGVQISSDPGAGDVYSVGEGVDVRLTFSDTALVTGTPRLKVRLADDGSQDKWAYYHSGSGTSALVFRYLPTGPEAGEDPDDGDNSVGIAVLENSLERDGGTIRQLDGAPVSLAHTGLAANPEHKVDTAPPQLVEVVLTVDPAPGLPHVGAGRLTMIYNEALNESSVPRIVNDTVQFDGRRDGAGFGAVNTSVVGNRVEIGIFGNSNIPPGETHTLSYSYDSTNASQMPIQDLAGNNAATFAGQANAVTARFVSNPSFTDGESATLSISENNADAASVGTVAATDLDGDTLTYSLAASDDASSFTIDSGTGEVKVASGVTLDHEAKDSYTVTAQVTDGDDPWGGAPRAVKMVSNTGQSHGRVTVAGVSDPSDAVRLVLQPAQPFTTGTHATGYTLTEVGLYVASWDANLANLTAEIWSTRPHGAPDSLLYTLTNPAAVTVGAVNTFTAPAGAMLAPETAYALVMRLSEGQVHFSATPSDVEDSGAASGWSIADGRYRRNANSVNQVWNPGLDAMRISVTASGRPLPDDTITIAVNVGNVNEPPAAAPTGVTVTGQSSRTLSLSWSAVAAAAGGPDPDGYDVRWFAGTADPGDAGDWVEPGEPGGHSTDGTDVTTVLGGLEPNTAYRVQMRAKSPDGPGPWSASVDGMTNNLPTVTIAGGSAVTEGTAAAFTVMIDEAPTADLTVNLEVSEAAGSDFVAAADEGSKTVIIASGATSATYLVTTQADTTNELHGAVTVEVVAGTGYGPGSNASATVTVNDDDAPTLPGRVLVSNAGQGGSLSSPLQTSRAQPFTTGSNAEGYTLSGVQFELSNTDPIPDGLTIRIMESTSTNSPGTALGTLTLDQRGTTVTGSTTGIDLQPNTTYFVAMNGGAGGTNHYLRVDSDNEDPGAAPGWTLGDTSRWSNGDSFGNSSNSEWKLSIHGSEFAKPEIQLSFTPATIAENAMGDVAVTQLTATLLGGSTRAVDTTVRFASALGGTAAAGASNDYELTGSLPQSVTIPAGMTNASVTTSFTIDPVDNGDSDGNRTITLAGEACQDTLMGGESCATTPSDRRFTVNPAVIILEDDDAIPVELSLSTASVDEGESVSVTLRAQRAVASNADAVTVMLAVQEPAADCLDCAVSGTDYTALTLGTLTIRANEASGSKTFTIRTTPDVTHEGAERIVIGGSATGMTQFAVVPVTLTINDDDDASTSIALRLDPTSGSEATASHSVRVTATVDNGAAESAVQIPLELSGTASGGPSTDNSRDYTTPSSIPTIVIPEGRTSATAVVSIRPHDDNLYEGDETVVFSVNTGNDKSTGGLEVGVSPATFAIEDDDTEPALIQLSFTPSTVDEDRGSALTVTEVKAEWLSASTRTMATEVDLASALGGTAVEGTGNDYELTGSLPGSVTIPAGMTSGTLATSFVITPIDNDDSDGPRTITLAGEACKVELMGGESCPTSPTDQRLTVRPAVLTLEDDDAIPVELSLSPASVDEGGSVSVTLRAQRAVASNAGAVTVTLAVLEPAADCLDCAVSGTDYAALTLGTLTIPVNQAGGSRTFTINTTQDMIHEGAERIVIGGSATGTTQFAVVPVTFTINDDDDASTSIALRLDPTSGSEATASHSVRVTATVDNGASEENVMVALALSGTATGGTASDDGRDYTTPVLPTITILAGQREAFGFVTIAPHNDDLHEPAETIIFGSNGNSTGGLTVPVTPATFSLTSDDTEPTTIHLSFTPSTVREDAPGDAMGDVTVTQVTATLVGPSTRAVDTTVDLASALGGTAEEGAGNDYELTGSLPGSVTIPAGMSSGSVTASFKIDPVDDDVFDGDRTIELAGEACKVALTPGGNCPTSPTDQRLTVRPAVLTLAEDDLPKITLSTSRADGSDESLIEGQSATFTVKALRGQGGGTARLSVPLQALTLATGGATSGTDYVTNPASLPAIVIPANSDEGNATLTIDTSGARSDRLVEGNEKIRLGAIVAGFEVVPADITIQDNDNASTSIVLRLTPRQFTESNSNVEVQVTASVNDGAPTSDVIVELALEGTARGGPMTDASRDYTTPSSLENITIAEGQVEGSQSVIFPIIQDTLHEGVETIVIKDADGNAGGLAVTPATFTINDDDPRPTTIQLSFTPDEIDESASATAVTVTATLQGPSTRTVDTVVDLANELTGTAVSGPSTDASRDYTTPSSLPGSVTIPAGMSSGTATATFDVAPRDNSVSEPDKTIALGGSACHVTPGAGAACPSGQQFTVSDAVLTLEDDEDPVIELRTTRMGGSNTSIEEGSADTFTLTASRNLGVNSDEVTLQVAVQDASSAESGDDYAELSALPEITIPAGMATATATVNITTLQDRLNDDNETIVLGAMVASFKVVPATVTIIDDDALSTQIAFSLDTSEIDEDGGGVTVTARAEVNDAAPDTDVTIALALSGTARKGPTTDPTRDYSDPGTITITILDGQVSGEASFTITPLHDLIDEDDETITVTAATSSGGLSITPTPQSHVVTLNDNDTASTTINLGATPVLINEEAAGDITVTVRATLADTAAGAVTRDVDTVVDLASALRGTALGGGTDYALKAGTTLPGTLTIPRAMSSGEVTFIITANNDGLAEGDETITLDGSACQVVPGAGEDCPGDKTFTVTPLSITLRDDDAPQINLSAVRTGEIPEGQTSTSMGEGEDDPVTFTITASRNTVDNSEEITVLLAVRPIHLFCEDCAQGGVDYEALTDLPSITIPANTTSAEATVTVTARQDRWVEGPQHITLEGTVSGTDTVFTVNEAAITINDDDNHSDTITLSVDRTSVNENGSVVDVTVTATVNDGLPQQHVSVLLDLRGTAALGAGGDYSAPDSIAILINAVTLSGESTFSITPHNDDIDDDGETIIIGAQDDLSATPPNVGGSRMMVVPAPAITIVDDDSPSTVISLSAAPARIIEDVEDSATGTQSQAGATPVTITATLSGSTVRGSATTVLLDSILRGSAGGAGDDYTSNGLPASVTIPAESLSGSVTGWMVTPTLDDLAEGDETIVVNGSLSGFTVNPATLTLADNDQPEITLATERVRPRPGDGSPEGVHRSVDEGSEVTFRVTASRDLSVDSEAAEVVLAIVGGSARAGVDYETPRLTTIRIPRGRASATAQVTISSIPNRLLDGDRGISLGGSTERFEVVPAALTILDDDRISTAISLSVGRDTLAEDAGTVAMTVIATVDDGAPADDVTVAVSLGGAGAGSATSGADYADPGTITLTIEEGQTSGVAQFDLVVNDDRSDEDDETITLSGTASNFTVGTAVVTVIDNDTVSGVVLTASPAVGTEDPSEGPSTPVEVTVTATLSGATSRSDATVVWFDAMRSGTARELSDYVVGAGQPVTVTIPAGSSSASGQFSFVFLGDLAVEGDETIIQGGSACLDADADPCPSSQRLAVSAASITIIDDDAPQVALTVEGGAAEGASSQVTVTAARAEGTSTDDRLSVPLAVVGGTAVTGVDYAVPRLGTVVIAAGETSGTAVVTISAMGRHDDRLFERNETILIGVRAASGVRAAAPASVVFADNDSESNEITLELSRTRVAETAGPVLITATATVNSGAPTSDVTVSLTLGQPAASSGVRGATSGTDYVSPGAISLVIETGETSGTASFVLNLVDDRVDEGDEVIAVSGGTSTGGLSVTVTPTVEITVTDDDAGDASEVIDLSISPGSVSESGGDTTLAVIATLSGRIARGTDTTVTLDTALGGTAAGGGTDYALKTGSVLPTTVTIPAGSLSGSSDSFVIALNNDTLSEGDETITMDGSLAGFTVSPAAAVLVDNDAPVITLSASGRVTEGSSASVTVTATRSLSPGGDDPQVRVPLAVLGGSATPGADYAALRRLPVVVIGAGKTSGSAVVSVSARGIADDRIREHDERIVIGRDRSQDDSPSVERFTVEPAAITIADDDSVSQQIALRVRRAGSLVSVTATLDGAAPDQAVIVTLSLTGAGAGAVVEPPLPITIPAGQPSASTAFVIDSKAPFAGKSGTVSGVATGGLTVPVGEARFTVAGSGSSSSGSTFGGGGGGGGAGGGGDDDADEPDEPDEPEQPEEPPVPDVALTRALRDQAQALAAGVDEVLVVNAWSPADIAVAAALAARRPGARVIYVSPRGLARGLSTLLGDLDPAKVTLVGGSKALGADVRRGAQAATEDADVDRLAGRTRIDTAAEAARLVLGEPSVPAQRTLIIANGWSPADTGAAAALAARTPNSAVLYTTRDALPGATESVIEDYQPANIVIVGGSRAASEEVLDAAADAAPDAEVERFAGATRVDTAAQTARQAFDAAPADAKRTVIVANGWSPADIGAATALAARIPGAVVLYTERGALPDATESVIEEYSPSNVVIIGGPAAVPARVVGGILAAAQSGAQDRTAVHRISGRDRLDTAVRAALFTLPDS